MRLGVSLTSITPTGSYSLRFGVFSFPALESWVVQSVVLPSCSSLFIHAQMWDLPVLQPLPCHTSSPTQLPVSDPHTGRDKCFFFISFVVGLPYSSIFWQFLLLFVFKFVVVLLLVRQGSKAYLPMLPSFTNASISLFLYPFIY